jgi:hypothetical protein
LVSQKKRNCDLSWFEVHRNLSNPSPKVWPKYSLPTNVGLEGSLGETNLFVYCRALAAWTLIVLSVKMFKLSKHIIFIEHNFVKENRPSYDNLIYLPSTQLWYSLAPYQIFDQFLHKTLMISRNFEGLNSHDVLNLH